MAANLDRAETSLTAVSDIAYIRGIDGSGNSVRISKADLASVLGVIKLENAPSGLDANNINRVGVCMFILATQGTYQNMPTTQSSSTAFLIQIRNIYTYMFQIYVSVVDCKVYIRSKNNESQYWGWKLITTN